MSKIFVAFYTKTPFLNTKFLITGFYITGHLHNLANL